MRMRTFSWHRDGVGRYVSSDGRFTIASVGGISAGFAADGSERFRVDGWLLHDSTTGSTTEYRTLRDAKYSAEGGKTWGQSRRNG